MAQCCTCDTVEDDVDDDVLESKQSKLSLGVLSGVDSTEYTNEQVAVDESCPGTAADQATKQYSANRSGSGDPCNKQYSANRSDDPCHKQVSAGKLSSPVSVRSEETPTYDRLASVDIDCAHFRSRAFSSVRRSKREVENIESLRHRISSFMEERTEKRLDSYLSVVTRAGYIFISSVFLATASDVLRCIDFLTALGTLGRIIRPMSILILDVGIVLLGSCPANSLDIDELLKSHASVRMLLGVSLALLGCVKALFTYPYASVAAVPLALMLVIGDRWRRMPSYTSLLVLWLLVDQLAASVDDHCGKLLLSNSGEIPCFIKTGRFGLAVSAALQACWWCRIPRSKEGRKSYWHTCPTDAVLSILLLYLIDHGLWHFAVGIIQATFGIPPSYVLESFGLAVIWLLPMIAMMVLGEDRLREIIVQRFGHNRETNVRDGQFIAELLESASLIMEGQTWWLRREVDCLGQLPSDPRRCWRKGIVLEVTDFDFVVEIPQPRLPSILVATYSLSKSLSSRYTSTPRSSAPRFSFRTASSSGSTISPTNLPNNRFRIPLANRNVTLATLIENAQNNLVCIDWACMTMELLSSSVCAENEAALARRLRPGEIIDFFISHSWHDDAKVKWDKLEKAATQFTTFTSREPTFWLDKVCIDQNNIGDGLRVLPVNIMACRQMLVLCGLTYPKRLWCAWELCTLLALSHDDSVYERIVFVPMHTNASLHDFHHRYAHCFDPNEEVPQRVARETARETAFRDCGGDCGGEARLTTAILAVGSHRFNKCVRGMASKCRGEWKAPGGDCEAVACKV